MRFWPYCENILIPKNKRLYCRVCDTFFNFDINIDEYIIVQKIRHENKESTNLIVKESIKMDIISSIDRKAFEDFFKFHK